MKVLLIDPWLSKGSNLFYYTTGMAGGISKCAELTVVGAYNLSHPQGVNYDVINWFFKKSNGMKRGKLRTAVRGFEYVTSYLKALHLAKKEKFDTIHIEWPLMYGFDAWIYKKLKKHCGKLVIKAHNVLPHSTGEKYVEAMRKLYQIADAIPIHGNNIRAEFEHYYPNLKDKLYIQRYGFHANHDISFDPSKVDSDIKKKVEAARKVYIFFGRIDYDKGLDRLIDIWTRQFSESSSLLVIAGRIHEGYKEFKAYEGVIENAGNILFLNRFIEDNLLNYLIDASDAVLLPYRKAYMSAVAFTAAEFAKPILATNFGAVDEYAVGGENAFIVDNKDEDFAAELTRVENEVSNDELKEIGKRFRSYFIENYNWDKIAKEMCENCYSINNRFLKQ